MKQPEWISASKMGDLTAERLATLDTELLIHNNGITFAVIVPYGYFMRDKQRLAELEQAIASLPAHVELSRLAKQMEQVLKLKEGTTA